MKNKNLKPSDEPLKIQLFIVIPELTQAKHAKSKLNTILTY